MAVGCSTNAQKEQQRRLEAEQLVSRLQLQLTEQAVQSRDRVQTVKREAEELATVLRVDLAAAVGPTGELSTERMRRQEAERRVSTMREAEAALQAHVAQEREQVALLGRQIYGLEEKGRQRDSENKLQKSAAFAFALKAAREEETEKAEKALEQARKEMASALHSKDEEYSALVQLSSEVDKSQRQQEVTKAVADAAAAHEKALETRNAEYQTAVLAVRKELEEAIAANQAAHQTQMHAATEAQAVEAGAALASAVKAKQLELEVVI